MENVDKNEDTFEKAGFIYKRLDAVSQDNQKDEQDFQIIV